MGCWNESCALSGIDLPHHTKIYVAMIGNERFGDDIETYIPPVLGTYDDYGGIDLLEDFDLFGLKAGDNWRPSQDRRGHPIFLDAEVFDFLVNLEMEFTRKGCKTIGDTLAHQEKGLREAIAKMRPLSRYENKDYWEAARELDKYLDFQRGPFNDAKQHLENAVLRKKDEVLDEAVVDRKVEQFIRHWGRAFVLKAAQRELRKKVVPGITGPQHGGAPALIQFYGMVLTTSKRRQAEWNGEMWSFEELDKDYPLDRWKAEVALDQTQLSYRDWQIEKANAE